MLLGAPPNFASAAAPDGMPTASTATSHATRRSFRNEPPSVTSHSPTSTTNSGESRSNCQTNFAARAQLTRYERGTSIM